MADKVHPSEAPAVGDRLLDAAEQIVARDGVGNLTLEAVAREAGVSKGGLLYHFRSKSALVLGIVERLAANLDGELNRALANDPGGAGAFTRACLTIGATHSTCDRQPIYTALLAAAGTDPEYLAPMRARMAEWQTRLEHDGLDPALTTIVRLALDGLNICSLFGLPVPGEPLRGLVLDKLRALIAPCAKGTTEDVCST